MATKVVIQELVSKYVFEVDRTGSEAYQAEVKKGAEAAEKASERAVDAAKEAQDTIAEYTQRKAKEAEELEKRKQAAGDKASKRAVARAERASKQIEAAKQRQVAAEAAGDTRAASKAIREIERAERTKARATERAARQRARAERGVERETARAARRARLAVAWESSLAAKASAKAAMVAKMAWSGLKTAALAGLAAGAALAAGAIALVNEETERLDHIAKDAQKTGLGTDQYQRLAHIAKLSGTETENLAKGIQALNMQLEDVALGGGEAAKNALGELGLTAKDLDGKTAEQQLGVIAQAMKGVADDADKTRIAVRLMGEDGAHLLPLLNNSVEALDEMAASTGRIFTREELAKAEEYQDALANVKKAISDAAGGAAVELAPILTTALESAREFFPYVLEHFNMLYDAVQPTIKQLWEIAKSIYERLKPSFEELRAAVIPVIERLGGGLGGVLNFLGPAIDGAVAAIQVFVSVLSGVLKVGVKVYDWIVDLLDKLKTEFPRVFEIIGGVIAGVMNPIDTVRSAVEALFDWLERVVGKVGWLADKVREIKSSLGLGGGTGEGGSVLGAALGATGKEDEIRADMAAKDAPPAAPEKGAFSAGLEGVEIGPSKAPKAPGGGKAQATGLQAQIEASFKQSAADAELRASARALREGKSPKEAFKIGKEAAKQTERRLRDRFEETGELPMGISRDIQQLAASPAVEDSIGNVPPPVISVTNNVNHFNVSGNTFETNVDARLTDGTTVRELTTEIENATRKMLREDLGEAVANTMPSMRV